MAHTGLVRLASEIITLLTHHVLMLADGRGLLVGQINPAGKVSVTEFVPFGISGAARRESKGTPGGSAVEAPTALEKCVRRDSNPYRRLQRPLLSGLDFAAGFGRRDRRLAA